jgi:glycosyltransferase involved in cell wall biosynthesis
MAGPGIRYLWFARELARHGHDVTLVVPFETDLAESGFEVLVDNPWHSRRMTKLAERHDAVVAQRLPVPTMLALARSPTRAVYDLYAPLTIEHAALMRAAGGRADAATELNQLTMRVALETGDAFICASERQRDLWLGALAALGRVGPVHYARDPTFRGLVEVVPFGIDPKPPVAAHRVLKGVVPGIEPDDKVALWAGGIWNWFDPLTVIRAVHRLGRPELKLYFLGTRHPNPAVPEMAMRARAVEVSQELGLHGTNVFFNEGWVPYEERGAYLLEADVGVSAHFDELEARFAFRTRLLDCIWAGLPMVTTAGDSLADAVEERQLGRTVAYEDVDGYAESLSVVLAADRATFAERFAALREELAWPRVVEPLAAMLDDRLGGPPSGRRPQVAPRLKYVGARARLAVETRGVTGSVRRLLRGREDR